MKAVFSPVKRAVNRLARTATTPAPAGGLNTRDPLAAMNEIYAVSMTNWIASPTPKVREGYRNHATAMTGYVETLAAYNGLGVGTDRLFAWANNSIYNVTNSGAVGAALVTGLSSNNWFTTGFTGSAGNYLIAANGVDPVRHYNGASWVTWTPVGSPANPGETSGVTLTTLTNPVVHQRRLWFVQVNTTKAYYFPVNSVGGAATAFDFGPAFPRGGNLVALASWSLDAGNGINNFLLAVSSEGDVVIYQGTDPASASTWSITGTWRLAAPATDKCFFQFGGDQLYLSKDGVQPMSKYMQSTTTATALTDTIQPTLATALSTLATTSPLQLHDVLSKNLLILNVPQIDLSKNVQFVFNTVTKGWTIFTGWPAQCWATLNGTAYFGADGKVCQAFVGYKDNAAADGSGGDTYTATCQQAFSYFDQRAVQKRFTTARINLITASGSPNVLLAVNTDYSTNLPTGLGSAVPTSVSLWGVAVWGIGVWSSGMQNYNAWQTVTGVGYSGSITLAVSVLGETSWVSTDWIYETGGILG